MKKVDKETFYDGINLFNNKGKKQIHDAMPSSRETHFNGESCFTDWICQRTRKKYGKTIMDMNTGVTEYFIL